MFRTSRRALLCALISIASTPALAASPPQARAGAIADATPPRANAAVPAHVTANTLHESFEDVTTLTGKGWVQTNHSQAVGSTNWFQGNNAAAGGPFDAFNGAANAYIGANYNNTGNTGTISNWLITPLLDFGSAQSFTFYTRKVSPDQYADRLEVRLSSNGSSSDVGTSANDVGDFGNVVLSVNPNQALGVYPVVWTQYTISSGLPHSGQGRLAFRYFVTGGGLNGTASDYIGIDEVNFSSGAPEYPVTATVSGLAGAGLSLQLNGGTPVAVAANGQLTFPNYVVSGNTYTVQVGAQPTSPSQTCTVSNGTGTISGNVTNVAVTCATNSYSVGGTVSGLVGTGLSLQNNGGDTLSISSNGGFSFATSLLDQSAYNVTVLTQPGTPAQTCAVSSGTGTLAGANVSNVAITCTVNHYAIGGEVVGLGATSNGLTLNLNGTESLPISGNGSFAFATTLTDGAPYAVSIGAQPGNANGLCVVFNGSGVVAHSDVATIDVVCDVIYRSGFEDLSVQ